MSTEARIAAEGLDASGLRIAIVRSGFNLEITDGLLEGARDLCEQTGVLGLTVVDAPGAFELPLIAQALAGVGHDAVVALGAVIEGETDHYEHIANRASEGLMRVMLDTGVPVAFGILTVREWDHARARSDPGPRNKGAEAALAAIGAALALRSIASTLLPVDILPADN